jgi:uncharacterized protein YraI
MKIALLLLSSAALLAVSSAAFADARNNVISGPATRWPTPADTQVAVKEYPRGTRTIS